jgi:hypothetical protein
MKLRIDHNELRLRLAPDDVAALSRTGLVEEQVDFTAGVAFRYRLEASDAACIGARLQDGDLIVDVPRALLESWAEDDRIGFEEVQPTGTGASLRILVEKDLRCLHRDEPEGSRYPNPDA